MIQLSKKREHADIDDMVKEIEKEARDERIDRLINSAVDRARMMAKVNNTYIVYMDDDGDIVKEYPDGRVEKKRK